MANSTKKRKIMRNIVTRIVEKAGADKVMHFLVCMAAAMAVGIGKELYDKATGEEFDWRDVAADAVGAVAGAAAWALMEILKH